MQVILKDTNSIKNDTEYHDISDRLRNVDRAIVQLILIKEDYEERIKEYLSNRDQSRS